MKIFWESCTKLSVFHLNLSGKHFLALSRTFRRFVEPTNDPTLLFYSVTIGERRRGSVPSPSGATFVPLPSPDWRPHLEKTNWTHLRRHFLADNPQIRIQNEEGTAHITEQQRNRRERERLSLRRRRRRRRRRCRWCDRGSYGGDKTKQYLAHKHMSMTHMHGSHDSL